ncbi:MAG: oligopeptide/dipeptide ABC transporter ATP-binding protein [Dysosmobacter welbionis]
MYAGEIVESGTIAEVFDHPHHPYTIGLFGSIPSLDGRRRSSSPSRARCRTPRSCRRAAPLHPVPLRNGACRTRKPEMTGVGGTQMVRCLAHQGVFESPN